MSKEHIVKQGEHLSRIAQDYGFCDYKTIWDYGENAGLKAKRQNPHVLLAGDRLVIPDKDDRIESCATGKRHYFKTSREVIQLKLVVKDFDDLPIKNADCELQIESEVYKLKTDGSGKLEKEIPKDAESGMLRIPEYGIEMPIKIGHLDPSSEDSGWQGRLANLGYNPGPGGQANEEQLRNALEEFQCDQKLKVTGKPDAATLAKLKSVHGS
jgi:hypothetical protein